MGGEARAQVTCFCAAGWDVTDPFLNLQAASPAGGSKAETANPFPVAVPVLQQYSWQSARGRMGQIKKGSGIDVGDVTALRSTREIDHQTLL